MEIKTPKRVFPVLVRRTVPLSREVGASGWYAQTTICSWMASQFARVQELDPPKDDKSPSRLLHFSGNAPHRTCRLCDTHREPVLMVSQALHWPFFSVTCTFGYGRRVIFVFPCGRAVVCNLWDLWSCNRIYRIFEYSCFYFLREGSAEKEKQ